MSLYLEYSVRRKERALAIFRGSNCADEKSSQAEDPIVGEKKVRDNNKITKL